MNRVAPRSIDSYLKQLREELTGADPSLIQDALYDSEEYLRAEIASHPGKSEADVLELIASTYGAPDEVAAAYRETEAKVAAALRVPPTVAPDQGGWRRFFSIFSDPRAYASLFFMLFALALGIFHFVFAVVGISLSLGFAVLVIGIPFFLLFIGLTRAISLADGRFIEAISGERMPRRPVHPGPTGSLWTRIRDMLKDVRTWTTLAYFLLSLPLGIVYFVIATAGLSIGLAFTFAPFAELARRLGLFEVDGGVQLNVEPEFLATPALLPIVFVLGVLILTGLMHLARFIGRRHALFAKHMLVQPR
jgi:uncharacterized membrane protein